jgi:predicted  nucleic acid-binding Zn-ribbon protein
MTQEIPGGPLEQMIAQAEARIHKLTAHRDDLRSKAQAERKKFEEDHRLERHLSQLGQEERSLEREIAELEGRRYYDPDDPYAERADLEEPPDA